MLSARYYFSDFKETWIFSADFRRKLKYQVSSKFVYWEPTFSMRTDEYDEANSRLSQFCERAWKD